MHLTDRFTRPAGTGTGGKPKLTTQIRVNPQPAPEPEYAPEPQSELLTLLSAAPAAPVVRLDTIHSVVPADRLTRPSNAPMQVPAAGAVIEVVVASVCPDGVVPAVAGGVTRRADGSWRAGAPFRPIPGTARLRLNVVRELWNAEVEERSADHFVLRRAHATTGLWGRVAGKKPAGVEIDVKLPPAGVPVGEAVLTGRLYGDADAALKGVAEQLVPQMLDEARQALQSAEERRGAVRVPTRTPIVFYPVHGDGRIDAPIKATARDISTGGLCAEARVRAETAYLYVTFPDILLVTQWALLLRLMRTGAEPTCHIIAGRFRTDL